MLSPLPSGFSREAPVIDAERQAPTVAAQDTAGGPPLAAATLALIAVSLALGFISALELRHMSVAHGFPLPWRSVLATTMPRWGVLAATLPIALRLAAHPPPLRRSAVAAIHVALFLAISWMYAAVMATTMPFSNPVALAFAWSARLIRSYYNALPVLVSCYGAVLAAGWAFREVRERQRRSLRASQLEAQLESARLAALRARLQPHFLYNTLNAIAALVYDERHREAGAAIEQLSELLHASLRDDGREAVSLREEIGLAERYLALQQMRFGDRLTHAVDLSAEVADHAVPVLLLQPIVENAVMHGLDAGREAMHVTIAAHGREGHVEIRVENDGTALQESARSEGNGVGLSATRARLATAYGEDASLRLLPREGGGASVVLTLPRRPAGES